MFSSSIIRSRAVFPHHLLYLQRLRELEHATTLMWCSIKVGCSAMGGWPSRQLPNHTGNGTYRIASHCSKK